MPVRIVQFLREFFKPGIPDLLSEEEILAEIEKETRWHWAARLGRKIEALAGEASVAPGEVVRLNGVLIMNRTSNDLHFRFASNGIVPGGSHEDPFHKACP